MSYSSQQISIVHFILTLGCLFISINASCAQSDRRYLASEAQARQIVEDMTTHAPLHELPNPMGELIFRCDYQGCGFLFTTTDNAYSYGINAWSRQLVSYTNGAVASQRNRESRSIIPDDTGKQIILSEADNLVKKYHPNFPLDHATKRFIFGKDNNNWLEYMLITSCGATFENNRFVFRYDAGTNHISSFLYWPGTVLCCDEMNPLLTQHEAEVIAKSYLHRRLLRFRWGWVTCITHNDIEKARGYDLMVTEDALGVPRLVYRLRCYVNSDTAYRTPDELLTQQPPKVFHEHEYIQLNIDAITGTVLMAYPRNTLVLNRLIRGPRFYVDNRQLYMSYPPIPYRDHIYLRLDYLHDNPLWNGSYAITSSGEITVRYPDAVLIIRQRRVEVEKHGKVVFQGSTLQLKNNGIYVPAAVVTHLTGDKVYWNGFTRALRVSTTLH